MVGLDEERGREKICCTFRFDLRLDTQENEKVNLTRKQDTKKDQKKRVS
jgi:hypothetical protein